MPSPLGRRRLAYATAAALLYSISGLTPASSGESRRGWPGGCPTPVAHSRQTTPPAFLRALAATRQQVPHVFAGLTTMGQPAWPHFQIIGAVSLATPLTPGPPDPLHPIHGLPFYKAAASHACGGPTANVSILVFLDFPSCQIPCGSAFAFVTPTKTSWRLWTSYRV